jgi:hypothetical protein
MVRMVRKQISILQRHDALLDRLAREAGVSQAEIVRRAIEHEAFGRDAVRHPPDPGAWNEVRMEVAERGRIGSGAAPYRWNRAHAYEEA